MGEPISLLSFFLSTASAFGKLTSWFRQGHREQRRAVAEYFEQIAAVLREVAERIENGQPGQDTCRKLAVYAAELERILGRHKDLIAAGDLSVEETRHRLEVQLWRARTGWKSSGARAIEQDVDLLSNELARQIWEPEWLQDPVPHPVVDRLEREFSESVAVGGRANVQHIWDAAGEFAALADALRAR